MSSHARGLLGAALRGLAAPRADAELLGRYVAAGDGAAFAELVRRHGPMVHAVCRRRLGPGADADDAFQVTFMVLARDAAKIVRRESVPGWLFRVAALAGAKLAGRNARRPTGPLPDDLTGRDGDPAALAADRELRDALDREIAALPDKLRTVVVLCGLEEKTNAEAAALLGCPTGTINSRLSAARKTLKARLARRGLVAGPLVFPDALGRAARTVPAELIESTTRAAVHYAAGSGSANPLTPLADGVTPTMGTTNLKLLVAVGMSLALFGTIGAGLFHAAAQEKPAAKPGGPIAAADPPAKPDPAPPTGEPTGPSGPKDEAAVRAILDRPLDLKNVEALDFQTFLNQVTTATGLPVWIDYAAFVRTWGEDSMAEFKPSDRRAGRFPSDMSSLSLGELLTQVLASAMPNASYRVQGNRVVIVPAFKSALLPGDGSVGEATPIPFGLALEQTAGPPVSFGAREQALPAVLATLRQRTGANIVLDPRAAEAAKAQVTAAFDDVRLLTVLTVLAETADLEVVTVDNVFFLTTPENAARLRARQERAAPLPAPRPAKPVEKK